VPETPHGPHNRELGTIGCDAGLVVGLISRRRAAPASPPALFRLSIDHRHGFHLKKKFFFHQAIDDEQSVWRVRRFSEERRKCLASQTNEIIDALTVDQIGRELDDIFELSTNPTKGRLQIGEDLAELRVELPDSDDLPFWPDGKLSGDVCNDSPARQADMRVETLRGRSARRISYQTSAIASLL
jgi:hypothetical protein